MRKRLAVIMSSCALGLMAIGGSPASARPATGDHHFAAGVARLDGNQEVPPADPDGRGTFAYIAFDSTLCYVLSARNIAPAAAAHIHQGARGVNGGIVVSLIPPTDRPSHDCIEAVPNDTPNDQTVLLQSELDAIIANPAGFYANVHNAEFPNGAIRGQLR